MSKNYVSIKSDIVDVFSKLAHLYNYKRDDLIHEALVSYIVKLQSEVFVNDLVKRIQEAEKQDPEQALNSINLCLLEYCSYFNPKLSKQIIESTKKIVGEKPDENTKT